MHYITLSITRRCFPKVVDMCNIFEFFVPKRAPTPFSGDIVNTFDCFECRKILLGEKRLETSPECFISPRSKKK